MRNLFLNFILIFSLTFFIAIMAKFLNLGDMGNIEKFEHFNLRLLQKAFLFHLFFIFYDNFLIIILRYSYVVPSKLYFKKITFENFLKILFFSESKNDFQQLIVKRDILEFFNKNENVIFLKHFDITNSSSANSYSF